MPATLTANKKNETSPKIESHRFLQLVDLVEMLGEDVTTFRDVQGNTKVWIDGYVAKKWGRKIIDAINNDEVRNVTFPCAHWIGQQEKANFFAPVGRTSDMYDLFTRYVQSADHRHLYTDPDEPVLTVDDDQIKITEPLPATINIMRTHAQFMVGSGGFWFGW